MKIKISTDSTADIPVSFQKELNITVLPLTILTEDGSEYEDGVDMTPQKFYSIIENCNKLPYSAAVPPSVYMDYYTSMDAESYTDIIHVALNSKGSSTFQNAEVARNLFFEEYPDSAMRIHIIDSQNYSGGYGMAVIEAARMARNGASVEEIIAYIEDWLLHVRTVFLPFNLKCVRKSGRLSAAAAVIGDILAVKPIISFKNGESITLSKTRGEQNAIRKLVQTIKSERRPGSRFALAIVNNPRNYQIFKEMLLAELGEEPEFEYELGCIIMINAGSDAIGIVYYQDN